MNTSSNKQAESVPIVRTNISEVDSTEPKKIDFCDTWYYHDIKDLPQQTRQLFEEYSGIPPHLVIDHVQKMRSRAFDIYPYPCIGQLRFLNLSLSHHPLYPEVLSRLRPRLGTEKETPQQQEQQYQSLSMNGGDSGIKYPYHRPQKFLDLGCCLAQDLRKLVLDGAPSENLYGLDIEERFLALGYEMFRDSDTLKSKFVVQDMLLVDETAADSAEYLPVPENSGSSSSASSSLPYNIPLASLSGQISIIAANSFFHLYNYSDQLQLAKRVVRLLEPERGALILGRQVGSTVPGEYTAVNSKGTRYSHDVASFRQFWGRVGEEIGGGCRFRVEATVDEEELGENKNQGQNWAEPNIRRLRFGVWRE